MTADPIPAAIWDRIIAFLAAGKTGHITLWVNQGRVTDAALEERVRPKPVVDSPRPRGV
jgi:hypothetical protein